MNPAQWLEARYDECVTLRHQREELNRRQARTDDPDESLALAREHHAISRELTQMGDQT